MDLKFFALEDIKELCLEFDKKYGSWPEDQYQGLSLYNYICRSQCDYVQCVNSNDIDMWRQELKEIK